MKFPYFLLLALVLETGACQIATAGEAYFCPPCNSSCDEKVFARAGKCDHCGMELELQSFEEREALKKERRTVAFYLQDGVEVLDFAGPMEVFAYAGYEVFTVSKKKEPIVSQGILTILPDYSIEDAPEADIMAFFGGNSSRASGDPEVIEWVRSRIDATELFFSVCTGAFIMGEAGLLDGQTVTTFHDAIEGLRKSFPKAKVLDDVRFVDNGDVITTAGISAGIDGAIHLVERLEGKRTAKRVIEYMEYDNWVAGQGLVLSDPSLSEKD
ncbi:MAG: DJ-1/PfpI family protein [Bacteroidota bacterium]